MPNLAYLNVYCSHGHPRRRLNFIGYDFAGNARYQCTWRGCGEIRRYRYVYGRIKRVFY